MLLFIHPRNWEKPVKSCDRTKQLYAELNIVDQKVRQIELLGEFERPPQELGRGMFILDLDASCSSHHVLHCSLLCHQIVLLSSHVFPQFFFVRTLLFIPCPLRTLGTYIGKPNGKNITYLFWKCQKLGLFFPLQWLLNGLVKEAYLITKNKQTK